MEKANKEFDDVIRKIYHEEATRKLMFSKSNRPEESTPQPKVKLSPSKARILNMPLPILIEHFSMIALKISTLSSAQRKLVQGRVKFNLSKGKILQTDLDSSLNFLKQIGDVNTTK